MGLVMVLERSLILSDLGLGLALLGEVDFDLRRGFVTDVDRSQVLLLRVVKSLF